MKIAYNDVVRIVAASPARRLNPYIAITIKRELKKDEYVRMHFTGSPMTFHRLTTVNIKLL